MSFEAFSADLDRVRAALATFLMDSHAGQVPVVQQLPMSQLAELLDYPKAISHGGLTGEALSQFLETYLANSTRLHHPGFLAHQVSTPHLHAALGALVESFANNGMNIYEMGPAAATLEYAVTNWMLEHIGWQPRPWPDQRSAAMGPHGGGLLTHGGSLANLTALLAARAHAFPEAWSKGYTCRPAILAPKANHYSIQRALGIMGLGTDAMIHLEVDDHDRILPDRIVDAFARAQAAGFTPFALVANACATAAGLYDTLRPIGEVCKQLGLWLHVDGAHGASALVSPRQRHLLDGIELADSMIWDAHKMLATSALCAAVLVKDAKNLDRTFQQDASYLFHQKDEPGFDFMPLTVECTKSSMGLRAFIVLAALGEQGIAAHVDRLHDLGQEAWRLVKDRPGFSSPVQPQSNIVCFRYGDEQTDQLSLRSALLREGHYYIGSTLFQGQRYLRLAIMNPLTDTGTFEGLFQRIEELAQSH